MCGSAGIALFSPHQAGLHIPHLGDFADIPKTGPLALAHNVGGAQSLGVGSFLLLENQI